MERSPHRRRALAVSPDGSKVYAAFTDLSGKNTLAVISTASNTITQKIPLSMGASFSGPFVALSVDGTRAYVTLTNASQLAIVDTVSNQLLSTVSISPSYPVSLAVHPNGKTAYLVSNLSFSGIVVFDLTTGSVTGTIAAPGTPVPFNVAFTPDGSRAYMTEELGPVLIIDTASQKIVGQLPVGNSNSIGVTIAAH